MAALRLGIELIAGVPVDAVAAAVGLDVQAFPGCSPRCQQDGSGVEAVVLAEDGADGPGGLHGVVVRDGREGGKRWCATCVSAMLWKKARPSERAGVARSDGGRWRAHRGASPTSRKRCFLIPR